MTVTINDTTDLCHVCLRRPATLDGLCDTCRPPWRTDELRWIWRDLDAALRRWTQRDVEKALALARAILQCAEPLIDDEPLPDRP